MHVLKLFFSSALKLQLSRLCFGIQISGQRSEVTVVLPLVSHRRSPAFFGFVSNLRLGASVKHRHAGTAWALKSNQPLLNSQLLAELFFFCIFF